MSDANFFIGFWKILACVPQTSADKKAIQGAVFQLSRSGDITWKTPGDAVSIPLFSCETYEVVRKKPFSENLLRFGAYKGHVIEFRIERYTPVVGMVYEGIFIVEGLFYLACQKLDDIHPDDPIELPFSLLPALEDSYFSDLTIVASNKREFLIHTCILKLSAPEIDWTAKPPPLNGLPEDVIGTILHYLYAQCLPPELDENIAKQVISATPDLPGLEPLIVMCQSYIRNLALKRKIISLISDMHACAAQVIDYFSNEHLNPVKLCYAVKSSIREAAVAGSKLLLLCDLYSKKKDELSREDSHEIIRYAKSRIPIFMSQIERLFQGVKSRFTSLLTLQKQELICYLVPEIENILDTIASLLLKVKAFLEMTLAGVEVEDEAASHAETLKKRMDTFFHKREMSGLRFLVDRITCIIMHLQQKKESFKGMTNGNKIRSVARNLEHLIERLPLEKVSDNLDEKLEWNEFQFCFRVGTSQVSEVIKNLLVHKEALQDLMLELCDLVQHDSFSQSLIALGLLDPSLSAAGNATDTNVKVEKSAQWSSKQHEHSLNLTDSLYVSPPPQRNRLSKAATQLLRTGQEADMVFEVITTDDLENRDQAGENVVKSQTVPKRENQILRIEAHRVIIAARCDWFRKALLSGMQEDINRKIEVHNTSPFLFSLFLEYLYSGKLDYSSLTVEQISELLLLGDRYELDYLKQACEEGLKSYIDDESVLHFFNMADHFNAKILKSACIQFIAQHPEVMDCELFEELPDNLQSKIYDLVVRGKPRSMYLSSEKVHTHTLYSVSDIEHMAANVHLNSSREFSRSENEELPLIHDSARLESAIEQLRDIVGPRTSRLRLVHAILAADYDISRALLFYCSSSWHRSHRRH